MSYGIFPRGDIAMARGRPKATLVLSEEERAQLASFARSRSLPSALSNRAKIIVASADGETNSAIASRLQINPGTVR
ncbi:DNA-binding NarL/FixJ family response regulator, partial [Variovorax boronicumulans]|nr:DNA-binding NarL/FixJ family response regulator [Variovorax boronicumulans]